METQLPQHIKNVHTMKWSFQCLLFTALTDVCDVGEEVVVFSLGHGLTEL